MAAVAPLASLCRRLTWDELDPEFLRALVRAARDEDLAGAGLRDRPRESRRGDRSTASLAHTPRAGRADLVAREPLIACGLPLLPLILDEYGGGGATARLRVRDGATVAKGRPLARLEGDPRVLLAAERVVSNFLQRLSGIATQTGRYVAALGRTRTRLLDTRKTTPGWRMLEKYAVACGGGWNHRLGLFDRVMLKDNHLALLGLTPDEGRMTRATAASENRRAGGKRTADTGGTGARLAEAVRLAKRAAPDLPVEVEVDGLAQIPAVLAARADVVLLDNFSRHDLKRAIKLIGRRARTEASGGITRETLPRLARLGLDFISTGALVHQSTWVDIGLDWRA